MDAAKVDDAASVESCLGILDLDLESETDEETWLMPCPIGPDQELREGPSWKDFLQPTHLSREEPVRKLSLVTKLDLLSKGMSPPKAVSSHNYSHVLGSPIRTVQSSNPASLVSCSTPLHKPGLKTYVDGNTFTRRKSSQVLLNSTFDITQSPSFLCNNSVDMAQGSSQMAARGRRSGSMLPDTKMGAAYLSSPLNATFNVSSCAANPLNTTFDMKMPSESGASLRPAHQLLTDASARLSRDSSHDLMDDDRLSTASESSSSHRFSDLNEVHQLARLQEEALRQGILPAASHRSATMSPSSEHSANSPSTEGYVTGNNMGGPSEEDQGPLDSDMVRQYSSQDSLPDSPYSSQSLEVAPFVDQARIGRSMPNLNKIRGPSSHAFSPRMSRQSSQATPRPSHTSSSTTCNATNVNKASNVSVALRNSGGAGQASYAASSSSIGALSRLHTSDPRLGQEALFRFQAPRPPSRGTVYLTSRGVSVPRYEHTLPEGGSQRLLSALPRADTMPCKSGIPRPGCRIPAPKTGIPKPSSSSRPPSTSSSSSSLGKKMAPSVSSSRY